VIESLLHPSRNVREGYRAETVVLASGIAVTGAVKSQSDVKLVLMVPGEDLPRTIPLEEIEHRAAAPSIMPAGLINQLSDEGEFFDLVSFVVALGMAGPQRAAELLPGEEQIAPPPLPDYERHLDHRGLIAGWDDESFEKGQSLYHRLCVNCHGTRTNPGSLPNALQFAIGTFRNGADPWSMYKTLTYGYRMMLPQTQLTPAEKYQVIQYIRDAYVKPHNPSQYVPVDADYLASLPVGDQRGPAPVEHRPWRDMDHGPFLIHTYELVGPETKPRPGITAAEAERARREQRPPREKWPANTNFAYKGIAVRLDEGPGGVAAGTHWVVFDHDTLRVAGAWSGKGFIDWEGILLNGRHDIAPRTTGTQHHATPPGPGWADPQTGSWEDPRLRGKDGRPYGPLPRKWAHYKGLYKHGRRVVISYTVGNTPVLESYRLEQLPRPSPQQATDVWVRVLNVGLSSHDLTLRVAQTSSLAVAVTGIEGVSLVKQHGDTLLKIPAAQTPCNLELRIALTDPLPVGFGQSTSPPEDLHPLTRGGPAAWPEALPAIAQLGDDDGPLAADTLTRPARNPWRSRMRFAGLDFLDQDAPEGSGRLVVCSCDGDVWVVEGIDRLGEAITWRRIAAGLFQPLGLKVVGDQILVGCRDQIVCLRDLNGDGETDFYESFNNDHQVTDHFHEFAMGLQADPGGNLYYAKSARHARDSLVPQHGTLLRVSPDGKRTTILANGFRAANGVCLNNDGSFFVTDQEGHWTPMNRINRVVEGEFYGNLYSYGAPDDPSDQAMQPPICWPDKQIDRSPAELVWVTSSNWGPLEGSLLSLSYGVGAIFLVPHEQVDGQWQGGITRLPLASFPTGIIRGRFHPRNGHLYLCGMQAWATNQTDQTGGLYRVRYTGRPLHLPIEVHAVRNGVRLTFTESLDPVTAADPASYLIETWSLRRSASYGSDHYDEQALEVARASLSRDGRTVTLEVPRIQPTQCMRIAYKLRDSGGATFQGELHNTIHKLP
jgi:hypothetical protein